MTFSRVTQISSGTFVEFFYLKKCSALSAFLEPKPQEKRAKNIQQQKIVLILGYGEKFPDPATKKTGSDRIRKPEKIKKENKTFCPTTVPTAAVVVVVTSAQSVVVLLEVGHHPDHEAVARVEPLLLHQEVHQLCQAFVIPDPTSRYRIC